MSRELISTVLDYLLPCMMILTNIFAIFCYVKITKQVPGARVWTIFMIISAFLFMSMTVCTLASTTFPLWKNTEFRSFAAFVVAAQQLSGLFGCFSLVFGAYFLLKTQSRRAE